MHVSQLADRFVRDPNDVVRVGQKVRVTVMSVDLERGRIALTMRSGAAATRRDETQTSKPATRAQRDKAKPAAVQTEVPKPGTIARNGMRFR